MPNLLPPDHFDPEVHRRDINALQMLLAKLISYLRPEGRDWGFMTGSHKSVGGGMRRGLLSRVCFSIVTRTVCKTITIMAVWP